MLGELLCRPTESKKYSYKQAVGKIEIDHLHGGSRGVIFGEQKYLRYRHNLYNAIVLDEIDYLSLGIFGLSYYFIDLHQVFDSEAGTIDCICSSNTNANIGLFDSDEIVGTVTYHPNFERTLTQMFFQERSVLYLFGIYLFIFSDYKGFILGCYSRKDFDPIM